MAAEALIFLLCLGGLFILSRRDWLLFHGLAEMFAVAVAAGIFVVAWNARAFLENQFFLFIGIAYLFVALLELLHALAYKGMNVFPGYGPDLATQLWIAARYLESVSFLAGATLIGRKLKARYVMAGFAGSSALLLAAIFQWRLFPACYVEGQGLTAFKVTSEYVICAVLLASAAVLYRKRDRFEIGVWRLLIASLLMTVAAELVFTLYTDFYGLANTIGHLLTVVSFYLIYKSILQTALVDPYNLLFRELKLRADGLHGDNLELRQLADMAYAALDSAARDNVELRRQADAAYAALDSAASGVVIASNDGIIRYANRALIRMFEYADKAQVLGQPVSAILVTGKAGKAADLMAAAGATAAETGEMIAVRRDGSSFPVEVASSDVTDEDGTATGKMFSLLDITQRQQALEAAAATERRYQFLAENVTDTIWTMDLGLCFTYVSPSASRLLGYAPEETGSLTLRQLLSDAGSELVLKALEMEQARDGGEGVDPHRDWTAELEMKRKDGTAVWTETTASFLRGADGRPAGILGVTRDITKRKELESQLAQVQKMESVGRLAGGVAHDFNNLLTAIIGHAQRLRRSLPGNDPLRRDVDQISKAAELSAELTRQLLAFSRKQRLRPQVLNLNAVVTGIRPMLRRLIGEDIQLFTALAPDLGRVVADPAQLEQVLINLATNARDAMPRGGKLTIMTANVELHQEYAGQHPEAQPGPHVMLSVSDTGSGMDAETKARLFEPFFTTKEQGKGTGLGLATVYGVVRQSGGHIWVHSEVGKGTAFKIYLPRVEAQPEAVAAGWPAEATPRGSEIILLVEDEDVVRELTRLELAESGYTVIEARNGREALEAFAQAPGPVHLLVTDVVMPELGGQELFKLLSATRPDLRCLYVSGYSESAVTGSGQAGPGTAYLEKPYTPEALLQKVREILDSAGGG